MAVQPSNHDRSSKRAGQFATTHWSIVLSAGQSGSPEAGAALARLCEDYWFPLYAFVRRDGYSADDAQDLTQEFFVRLLDKNYLAAADRGRGRFRSFLLGAMKHFLANQRRSEGAQKRGGGRTVLSLDLASAEDRYHRLEPVDQLTPERWFERRWALALLDLVLRRLREESRAGGKLSLFEGLKPFLAGQSAAPSHSEVAVQLGMSEGAVKVAAHRLRRRYRTLLKEEILRTIDDPAAVEDELRDLMNALGPAR